VHTIGLLLPLRALQRGEGRRHATGGTGAYATLEAKARFDVVANLGRGDITVTVDGRIFRSSAND
jgi:hypothetical protein